MSEISEKSETKKKAEGGFEKIYVKVGFQGDEKTVFFMGKKLDNTWNKQTNGPNNSRWHEWTLYQVDGGYRVLDEFVTCWQGESDHSNLSRVFSSPFEIARDYPRIVNHAVDQGIFSNEEIASPAKEELEDGTEEEEE